MLEWSYSEYLKTQHMVPSALKSTSIVDNNGWQQTSVLICLLVKLQRNLASHLPTWCPYEQCAWIRWLFLGKSGSSVQVSTKFYLNIDLSSLKKLSIRICLGNDPDFLWTCLPRHCLLCFNSIFGRAARCQPFSLVLVFTEMKCWQDWVGQRKTSIGWQLWWNWEVDTDHYPEWEHLVQDLSSRGVRTMTYCNPFIVPVSSFNTDQPANVGISLA